MKIEASRRGRRGRAVPMFSDGYYLLAVLCAAAVVGFAHAPHGPLAGAKAARGVDLLTRAVEVDLNVETVFAASVTKALDGGNLDLIDARTQFVIARVTDDIITLAN